MDGTRFVLAFLLVLCASNVLGHSYVTSPISRSNQRQSTSGCRGPACLGPCDIPLSRATRAPINIARGESISVQWPRNNHAGGFIRLAWASTSGSDSHANFDNGVQEIVCHEIGGCFPDSKSDPNGGDSGPADGSSRACTAVIQVPLHLTDGTWTLQWAWFGGAFALGDYYSCVDYKISGGPSGNKVAAVFIGGDYTYPGQNKCKFFNTDRLHQCVNEPCNNPNFPGGEKSGPAYMGNVPSSTSTSGAPLTTSVKSLTTSTPSRVTTNKQNIPIVTTGKIGSTTSNSGGVITSTSGNQNSANCAQMTNVVSSTRIAITAVELWGNSFRMQIRMDMREDVSNWMVQVIWPTDTQIQSVYNSGVLRCSSNSPVRHSMISPSSWSVDLRNGQSYFIELIATNTNMNSDFLKANTMIKMFKQ